MTDINTLSQENSFSWTLDPRKMLAASALPLTMVLAACGGENNSDQPYTAPTSVSIPRPRVTVTERPTATATATETVTATASPTESATSDPDNSDDSQNSKNDERLSAAEIRKQNDEEATERIGKLFTDTCKTVVDEYYNGPATMHDYSPQLPTFANKNDDVNPSKGLFVTYHVAGKNAISAVFSGVAPREKYCVSVQFTDAKSTPQLETFEASSKRANVSTLTIYSDLKKPEQATHGIGRVYNPAVYAQDNLDRGDMDTILGTTKFNDAKHPGKPISDRTFDKVDDIERVANRIAEGK